MQMVVSEKHDGNQAEYSLRLGYVNLRLLSSFFGVVF